MYYYSIQLYNAVVEQKPKKNICRHMKLLP